jgi:protein-S-isoprenylcysteine O-methyltransferase Ste14
MPVPWVFVLAYLVGVGLQLLVPVHVSSSTASVVIQIAGGVAFASGAGLAGWSLLIFRRAATTTVPGETSRALVTRGSYRRTRNPMYVGLVLAYLGEEGLLTQMWPLLFLPLAVAYVNWFVIPVEEVALRVFDGYAEYCAGVRRWI